MENDDWNALDEKLLCAMNWLREMSEDLTQRYLIDWNYPRTEKILRRRQRSTENKIANTIQEFERHCRQYAPFFIEWTSASMPHTMLPMVLEAAMTVLKAGLRRLENNFTQKQLLMTSDVKAVELLKSFCDLHPTEQEVNYHEAMY